jgi:hypothetical protein
MRGRTALLNHMVFMSRVAETDQPSPSEWLRRSREDSAVCSPVAAADRNGRGVQCLTSGLTLSGKVAYGEDRYSKISSRYRAASLRCGRISGIG